MPSHWGMVDRLCRELRRLRDDARAIDPARVEAAVVAETDAVIARAAAAVDATIDTPEDGRLFIRACDALALARERIHAVQTTARHSRALADQSVVLRATARLMHEGRLPESGEKIVRRA
jgi:hypothetical protein